MQKDSWNSKNKLVIGLAALCLVLTGVSVYCISQITPLLSQISSLNMEIFLLEEGIGSPLEEIRIGYISPSTQSLQADKPFIDQIIIPDMNAYCKQQGRNVKIMLLLEAAQSQKYSHLERVQQLKSMGVEIIVDGLGSSQEADSLSYLNTNKMIMLSYNSTSPTLAIANDRLFHLCPSDSYIVEAQVEMLWSYGIRHVCFIQRADSTADNFFFLFESAWKAKGGDFTGKTIRYKLEDQEFLKEYLTTADQQINESRKKYSADTIGGVLLSYEETPLVITQAKDYSAIYYTKWFGAGGTSRYLVDQPAGDPDLACAASMKLYSLLPSEPLDDEYTRIESRYMTLTGLPLPVKYAYFYDTVMITMRAMLHANSNHANSIVNLIQPLCSNYYGVSGLCRLNEYGDRLPSPFEIWGYGDVHGKVEFIRYGRVNPLTGVVFWGPGSR